MKKQYLFPIAEVFSLENTDVITTSDTTFIWMDNGLGDSDGFENLFKG